MRDDVLVTMLTMYLSSWALSSPRRRRTRGGRAHRSRRPSGAARPSGQDRVLAGEERASEQAAVDPAPVHTGPRSSASRGTSASGCSGTLSASRGVARPYRWSTMRHELARCAVAVGQYFGGGAGPGAHIPRLGGRGRRGVHMRRLSAILLLAPALALAQDPAPSSAPEPRQRARPR